ncbi:MAG: rhomboid family intramembrane serine protease [Planctomycetota bacterium]|nr:rhomboid family intramembrane serine protease [Planctomycetota bacterium]
MFVILPWNLRQPQSKYPVPWANTLIIAVTLLLFVLGRSWVVGPGTSAFSVVLYGFSHVGWWHLLFNMWALWIFGHPVNRRIGNVLYLVTYVGTILALGLVARLLLSGYLAGSSGALFAVIAIALLLLPATVLEFVCVAVFPLTVVVGLFSAPGQWFQWLVRWKLFSISAMWCLALIPLAEVWAWYWSGWSPTYLAHLGGIVCGIAAVLLFPTRITLRRKSSFAT